MNPDPEMRPDAQANESPLASARFFPTLAKPTRPLHWVLSGLFLGLLLSCVLLGRAVNHPHQLAKRAVCASNLRGLGQSMVLYAEDNNDLFPVHFFQPAGHDETDEAPASQPDPDHPVDLGDFGRRVWRSLFGPSPSVPAPPASSP